jgi:hypothetical protein
VLSRGHHHVAESTTVVNGGVLYEHCQCGAVSRTVDGRKDWHVCALCFQEDTRWSDQEEVRRAD